MNFNEKLLDLRKKAGLSQEELGNKLDISRQTVSKWEMGKSTPELDKLVSLSEIFNVSLDELIKDIEIPKEPLIKKKKINKYALLIIWIIFCIFLAFILYRYLSIRKFTSEYNKIIEHAKQHGGMITEMISKTSENSELGYTNYYFKGETERIDYYKTKVNDIGSNVTYLYKIEFYDKDKVYTIDEDNKTYSIANRTGWRENGPLGDIIYKIKSNLTVMQYKKLYNLYMTFNINFHSKFDKKSYQNENVIGLQKGDPAKDNSVFFAILHPQKKQFHYLENVYINGNKSLIDSISYAYSDIGKTLDICLQLPDLTDYTLIEE